MSFDPNTATNAANKAIAGAVELCVQKGNPEIAPAHLALTLFSTDGELAVRIANKLNIVVRQLVDALRAAVEKLPRQSPAPQNPPPNNGFRAVLRAADRLKTAEKAGHIAVDHLLLALYEDDAMSTLLQQQGLPKKKVEETVRAVKGTNTTSSRNAEQNYDALSKYGHNLVEDAENGKLDPVIGRDNEIRRVVQVLSRRTKNNPVLIGDPGVGKTAIVEGLAQRIVKGDVPSSLRNRVVISLDMGALIAGASYQGEFEDRLKSVLKEVKDSNGGVILFIDEIHMVLGAGRTSGAMDAANLLKPMLARGELRCIGATTLTEYRQHIEKDPAFERRFQQVTVAEPSVPDTISILRGLKDRYENHHGVRIKDGALVVAAQLANRYITTRFLPDKAIDLVDEACWVGGTKLLMYDGSSKNVEDIAVGDELIDDQGQRRVVLRLKRGNTQADYDSSDKTARRPAQLRPEFIDPTTGTRRQFNRHHPRPLDENGHFYCAFEGCNMTFATLPGMTTHEFQVDHSMPADLPGMFEITPKTDDGGLDSWQCTGNHTLVLRWNDPPGVCKRGDSWRVMRYALRPDGRGVHYEELATNFATEAAATAHAATLAQASWAPLVAEMTVHTFLQCAKAVQEHAVMFQPRTPLAFQPPAVPLRERLAQALGCSASTLSDELVTDTAWVLGVYALHGVGSKLRLTSHRKAGLQQAVTKLESWISRVAQLAQSAVRAKQTSLAMEAELEHVLNATSLGVRFADPSIHCELDGGAVLRQLATAYELDEDDAVVHPDLLRESVPIRRALLAGIMDNSGEWTDATARCCFRVQYRPMLQSIAHLLRGLGHVPSGISEMKNEWRMDVLEEPNLAQLNPLLQTKQLPAQVHRGDPYCFGFTIKPAPHAQYYGFVLDGSQRCLLDDFTVVHNCASIRVQLDSQPAIIDELERRKLQLEVEETAMVQEKDEASRVRLQVVREELSKIKEQLAPLILQHEQERGRVKELMQVKQKLEETYGKIARAERDKDLARVADLRYGAVPELEKRIKTLERALEEESKDEKRKDEKLLSEVVGPEQIAQIVSRWTGIPVTKLSQTERERLLRLGDHLHHRLIGQDEAVTAVANAVLRSRAGLARKNQPTGSFLFLGPTGVGKTELAKALAEELFDDEKTIVRLDMSEFMEQHSVARLIGSPPGYVGHDEGGQLTEAVRRKPYSVVLFDEVEKAHVSIWNVLLQVLDDGRLTDGKGRVVDFTNTVIIMTSNLGSEHLLRAIGPDGSLTDDEGAKARVLADVKKFFRPEFLNRLDDIVMFAPLTADNLASIVNLQLDQLSQRLHDRNIQLKLDPEAVKLVLQEAYDPVYGARPLKRWLERHIVTELSKLIIGGKLTNNTLVTIRPKTSPSSTPTSRAQGIGITSAGPQRLAFEFTKIAEVPRPFSLRKNGAAAAGGGYTSTSSSSSRGHHGDEDMDDSYDFDDGNGGMDDEASYM